MEFKPNEEQSEFLSAKDCNVLVSASAGSGKTSTMIHKLLKILCEDRIPISSLLVLTYTEAAASEIKLKLFNEISKEITEASPELKKYLKAQLDNINNAEIGTMHSICKKLIVKYFYEINQSPDFSVVSERESKYLLDTAIRSVFDKHIKANDEEFYELYDCYNSKRNEQTLKEIVIQLFNYLSNKINFKEWIDEFLKNSYDRNLDSNSACAYIKDYYKNKFRELVVPFTTIQQESFKNKYEKYLSFLYERLQFIDRITTCQTFTQFIKIIFNTELCKKPTKAKNCDIEEQEFDEKLSVVHKDFSELLKGAKETLITGDIDKHIGYIENSKKNVIKLIDIVLEIRELYNNLKRAKNSLDFNDLEDKMLELVDVPKIKEILKTNYKYVFFDEYQDINDKQEKIMSELLGEDNYFMIGDVKQSIYAFRQSSPKIFIEKFHNFKVDGQKNKVIKFNKNYRSDRNILDFNNFVFDALITEKTIGINYKQDSRFETLKDYEKTNVELKIINNEEINDDNDVDKERSEAIVVGDTILKLLTTKKSDGTNYEYKDIAIVMRQRGTFLKTLCDTLAELHIPINTKVSSELFDTSEVKLLISILKLITNFNDDLSMCVVLKNLFGVDEKNLYDIRTADNQYKNFYECVLNYSGDIEIQNKIKAMLSFINSSKVYLSTNTIKEYLLKVINDFQLLSYYKSLPSGLERVNHIMEFIGLTDSENYCYNIDKFLEYLEFVSHEQTLQKIGVGGAVQIITIHHSKGLEYPAVIFAGLGKRFSINKDTSNMIISNKFGVGLKSVNNISRTLNETLMRFACKTDNKINEINEEIRLLYVAMTRPKEKLILIGQYNMSQFEKKLNKNVYSSNCYLDMIFKSMIGHKVIFLNEKKFVINQGKPEETAVEIIDINDIVSESEKETKPIILSGVDMDLRESLIDVYKNKPSTQTNTIKNTVTNILKEESDYENLINIPVKLDSTDIQESIDFLKIGTAYHSVMQNLNFTETKDEIDNLINQLVFNGEISADVLPDINLEEIYKAKENLKDLVLNANQVFKEKQFLMQENYNKLVKNSDNNTKVIVQGVIDLVVIIGDNAYLIDYKTNRTTNVQNLISNYALQLDLYKLAFEKATNIKITHKYLYSFYMGKLIEII